MRDQLPLLTEMRRVVRPSGSIGLLVFMTRESVPDEQPKGNNFPTIDVLQSLVERAELRVEAWRGTSDLASAPLDWANRIDAVTSELRGRHSSKPAWQMAERQSDLIARLLDESAVTSELLVLRRR